MVALQEYFVGDYGTFRFLKDGRVAYCDEIAIAPAKYRKATSKEAAAYEKRHKATWALVTDNIGLCRYTLQLMKVPRDQWDDLVTDVGIPTLMKCKRAFDPSRGFAFSTYAVWALRSEYWRHIYKKRPAQLDESWDISVADVPYDDLLQSILERLNHRYRRALELYFFDGLTYREMAQTMGVSKARCEQLVKRALDKCRQAAEKLR